MPLDPGANRIGSSDNRACLDLELGILNLQPELHPPRCFHESANSCSQTDHLQISSFLVFSFFSSFFHSVSFFALRSFLISVFYFFIIHIIHIICKWSCSDFPFVLFLHCACLPHPALYFLFAFYFSSLHWWHHPFLFFQNRLISPARASFSVIFTIIIDPRI